RGAIFLIQEHGVGIEHPHHPDSDKIMALVHHFSTHKNVDFASVDLVKQLVGTPFAPGAVSVDTGQPGIRKVLLQEDFYALRPPAHGLEIKVATVWTVAWHRSAHAAMVALQVVTGLP